MLWILVTSALLTSQATASYHLSGLLSSTQEKPSNSIIEDQQTNRLSPFSKALQQRILNLLTQQLFEGSNNRLSYSYHTYTTLTFEVTISQSFKNSFNIEIKDLNDNSKTLIKLQ